MLDSSCDESWQPVYYMLQGPAGNQGHRGEPGQDGQPVKYLMNCSHNVKRQNTKGFTDIIYNLSTVLFSSMYWTTWNILN